MLRNTAFGPAEGNVRCRLQWWQCVGVDRTSKLVHSGKRVKAREKHEQDDVATDNYGGLMT